MSLSHFEHKTSKTVSGGRRSSLKNRSWTFSRICRTNFFIVVYKPLKLNRHNNTTPKSYQSKIKRRKFLSILVSIFFLYKFQLNKILRSERNAFREWENWKWKTELLPFAKKNVFHVANIKNSAVSVEIELIVVNFCNLKRKVQNFSYAPFAVEDFKKRNLSMHECFTTSKFPYRCREEKVFEMIS